MRQSLTSLRGRDYERGDVMYRGIIIVTTVTITIDGDTIHEVFRRKLGESLEELLDMSSVT